MRVHLLVLLAAVLFAGRPWAEEPAPKKEPEPGELTLATDRVVIFKDGFALFVKTATGAADKDGRIFTGEVPEGAVLGCFWAAAEDKRALAMRAEWVETRAERVTETACVTTLELLRANKGKKVTLGMLREKAPDLSGTVVDVLELPPEPARPAVAARRDPRAASMRAHLLMNAGEPVPAETEGETVRELAPRGGNLVALDTDAGRVVLPVAEVRSVAGAELATKMQRREEVTTRAKRLTFELGAEAAGKQAKIKILYFAEGLRWIPTYRISGELVDKAEIALQGEIVNEAEDIANAAVDLVVGVPNFRFKNAVSPLSLETALRQALATVDQSLAGNPYSNSNFQQRAGNHFEAAVPDAPAAMNLAPELAAAGQQDLFVYSARTMTLKKGARATLPLWQAAAPLRHLYTMDVAPVRDPRSGGASYAANENGGNPSPLKLAEQKVWHQLELGNNTKTPWTTGAALIVKDLLPLGQDMLTYTPMGGASLLPVTVAVDMCGNYQEEEIARQPNAMNWNGTNYTLIRKKATVTVVNKRAEKSLTRVNIGLGGKAEKASDNGKVRLDDFRPRDWYNSGYQVANNHSDVNWEFELEPGATKTLTFEITLYVY
ncbi:MAG: hypothetical protein KIS92_26625 [Planctomycetota bacterium]|nr:hypothetical protein [Planctomycetota bacterium]